MTQAAEVIILVDDNGQPLTEPHQLSREDLAKQDRAADLFYAYQWGEEAAQGNTAAEIAAFEAEFECDVEARAKFDRGMASVVARQRKH